MIGDLGLFSALKTKMNWHQTRQRTLAENVANADTPRYQAKDLKPLDFKSRTPGGPGPVRLATTDARHIGGGSGTSPFKNGGDRPFEVTPNGNAVNLEDQMMRVAENQMDYQAVTSLYQRGIGVLKTAIGRRA
jgi:flagellar basal-body rod protein FlgB